MTVVVRDQKGGVARGGEAQHTFSIAVLDANDAPVLPAAQVLRLEENSVAGAVTLNTFSATDTDSSSAGSLDYSIMSQTGPDGATLPIDVFDLVVTAGGGVRAQVKALAPGMALDFETCAPKPCRYTITVKVKDSGITGGCGTHCDSKFVTGTVAIEIVDVNEPPSLTSLAVMLDENVPTSADVATMTASDPENADLLYFIKGTRKLGAGGSCNGGAPGAAMDLSLRITSAGVLKSLLPLDFETIVSNPFCLSIKVQDPGGLSNELLPDQTVTVTVKDVNEPPVIAPGQVLTVDENVKGSPPTTVGTVVWSDQDAGDTVTLALTGSGMNDLAGKAHFQLRPGSNVVELIAAADHEDKASYTLDVTATDSKGLVGTGAVTVTINDVNEAPYFTSDIDFMVSEHNAALIDCTTLTFCLPGTVVGRMVAVDPDKISGVPEKVAYHLDPASNADGTFALDSDTGVITVKKITTALTTQKKGHVFNLQITAVDSRALSSTVAAVTVKVIERNFVPRFTVTPVGASPSLKAVPEGPAGRGQVVGTVRVVDPDGNYPLTVNIRSTDPPGYASAFTLTAADGTGGTNTDTDFVISVSTNAASALLDYEAIAANPGSAAVGIGEICLTMDAFDSARATASYAGHCVTIENVNEAPVVTGATITTAEGDAPGKVGIIHALDYDTADQRGAGGTPLTFEIDTTGWIKPCPFSLAPVPCASDAKQTCAEVKLDSTLDYEALKGEYGAKFDALTSSMSITVKVTDSKPTTVSAVVQVQIDDVNEPPTLSALSGGTTTPITVAEDAAVGTVLATIPVNDPDDVVKMLSFIVTVDGAATGAPELVTVEAQGRNAVFKLAAASVLDFEDQSSFTLQVDVTDGGNGNKAEAARTTRETITLQVTNVNDVSINSVAYKVASGGHPTLGEDVVVLTGTNFGPTQRKIDAAKGAGAALVASSIEVTYGALVFSGVAGAAASLSTTDSFIATGCKVTVVNTEIECTTQALNRQVKSTALQWFVKIDSDLGAKPSPQSTQYLAPAITAVSAPAAMPTRGGSEVIITGTNLGNTSPFTVNGLGKVDFSHDLSGVQLQATGCTTTGTNHDTLTCKTSAGTGTDLQWQVMVGGQTSAAFKSTAAFGAPSVTKIVGLDGADAGKLEGTGNEKVLLTGNNFGVVGLSSVGASFGPYTIPEGGCVVTTDHVEMTCTTVGGIGAGHAWKVYVRTGDAYQWSAENLAVVSAFRSPVLTMVRGANIRDLRTEGGQEIILEGRNFGPATNAALPCNDATRPIVHYGAGSIATRSVSASTAIVLGTNTQLRASCCKVISATTLSCNSAAGVGRDHSWSATLGSQNSNILASANTGYGPPVLASFTGPGAKDANTEGDQVVEIEGRNFGPAKLPNGELLRSITSVTYGKKGTEYVVLVADCAVTTDHFVVTCKTVKGAGKGMNWLVTIDGQQSITPSTWYRPPAITAIAGPTALSTQGGETLIFTGTNFGASPRDNAVKISPVTGKPFLQALTYGPNGMQYGAAGCEVTKSSTEIQCVTVPGVGSDLTWVVTIEDQTSIAYKWGTYEPPFIATAAPLAGPTEGATMVTLTGKGFGVKDPTSTLRIKFNGQLITSAVTAGVDDATGAETCTFATPEGHGVSQGVKVQVESSTGATQESNEKTFTYDAPQIRLLTTKWANKNAGLLQVTVSGSNFCKGTTCGQLYIDGAVRTGDVSSWSHSQVVFTTSLEKGDVMIGVGQGGNSRKSNAYGFAHLSPLITQQTISELEQVTYDTVGGAKLTIRGFYFGRSLALLRVTVGGSGGIGATDAVLDASNFRPGATVDLPDSIDIVIPAGQGANQELIVWRSKTASPAAMLSYKRPSVTGVIRTADGSDATVGAVGPTIGGTRLSIQGNNFGNGAVVMLGGIRVDGKHIESRTHTLVTLTLPPGTGKELLAIVWAGNQNSQGAGVTRTFALSYESPTIGGFVLSRRRRLSLSSSSSSIDEHPRPPHHANSVARKLNGSTAAPTSVEGCPLTGPSPSSSASSTSLPPGSTKGGQCITVVGTNFGTTPPEVFFGPYPAAVIAHDTVGHTWVVLASPEGFGAGLVLQVKVGNQDANSTYSYKAPLIQSVSPTEGPTSGKNAVGQPIVMTITGSNFGATSKAGARNAREVRITPTCKECDADKGPYPYVIKVAPEAFIDDSHDRLRFYMPEGYGVNAKVSVRVGNQDSVQTSYFTYSQPKITSLTSFCGSKQQCRAPTERFETDGCADLRLWEEYTEWVARRTAFIDTAGAASKGGTGGGTTGGSSAVNTVSGRRQLAEIERRLAAATDSLDRHCGFDNDRWQMAVIEGTSLGSTALAQAGAPLRISVTHGGRSEVYELTTVDCADCIHTHTRIVARSASGFGQGLNLTVALGDSVSNALPWSFKAPEVMHVDARTGSSISATGLSEVFIRGRNFGWTTKPETMGVRVFMG